MSFPKYKELNSLLTNDEIDKELFLLQKSLFDLRMKKLSSQVEKPHVFIHLKRRIAQLKMKKHLQK